MNEISAAVANVDDDHHIVGTPGHETQGGRVLKHDDAFLVVDRLGEILPSGRGEKGLFYKGTRYVSRFRLRFGKRAPMLLCSSVLEHNLLLAVDLANPEMQGEQSLIPHGTVHVSRRGFLKDNSYLERICLGNYGSTHARFPLRLDFDADFADIFEVRGTRRHERGERLRAEHGDDWLLMRYEGLDHRLRATGFVFSQTPKLVDDTGATFDVELGARAELTIDLHICCQLAPSGEPQKLDYEVALSSMLALQQDESAQTVIQTSNRQFNRWLSRSRADLRMLATHTQHGPYPYAGVPWFSAVFGRDGIWTAFSMLWVEPTLAAGVLSFLAAHQARELDAEADAEPGKIVHEMRDGEMAALREVPFGRYYGSIDSTPLYLMLAAAYYDATGDAALIERLWPSLLLALEWMDQHGDADGDGFIEYGKRSSNGLIQQGWKDSHDSVFHADGEDAEGPIALCEVQGYAFAARRGMAKLASMMRQPELAAECQARALSLQQRFDAAFWCEDLSTYALALDGKKRPCRVKSSNAGHCLYTGIALPSRWPALCKQLMSADMFSGWGVRTLAANERRYNPMSYHNGSIWPHDNAIIAEGLARAGHRWEAAAVLEGFFDAASFMEFQRLPELFCGFTRHAGQEPIAYPVACMPQAWASGAPFSLLRAVLGIEIDAANQRVTLHRPILPAFIDTLDIRRLRVGREHLDLRLIRYPEDVGVLAMSMTAPIDIVVIK